MYEHNQKLIRISAISEVRADVSMISMLIKEFRMYWTITLISLSINEAASGLNVQYILPVIKLF